MELRKRRFPSPSIRMIDTVQQHGSAHYRGRFAPTPSGPLHLGSLLTAVASYLDARHAGGDWLLRIDDLDRQRCLAGADTIILQQLESHGLYWDGPVRYQSACQKDYEAALKALSDQQLLYACACTRAELTARSKAGCDGAVYDGHCRALQVSPLDHALRFMPDDGPLQLADRIQGCLQRDRRSDIGDFVVRRSDGIFGYHLACVVDEGQQAISHVVRGADLIGASFCQLNLQQALGLPAPIYAHLPVLVAADGRKLSKQNHAPAIDHRQASDNLWRCLDWLQQSPPLELAGSPPPQLLDWAVRHWRLSTIPPETALRVEQPL